MTSTQAAYNSGVLAALAVASAIADTIEARGSSDLRQQSAAAALRSLAEDGRTLLAGVEPAREVSPVHAALDLIAEVPGTEGAITCPVCAGRLRWSRAASNGHVWGECETEGCLRWVI